MDHSFDENIHILSQTDCFAYALKYIDDTNLSVEEVFEKYKPEFIKKFMEYVLKTDNLRFIYNPSFPDKLDQNATFVMKFKRMENDEIFFKESDEKT